MCRPHLLWQSSFGIERSTPLQTGADLISAKSKLTGNDVFCSKFDYILCIT